MSQLPGNKATTSLREPIFFLLVNKNVFPRFEADQLLMNMQAGAVDAIERLGQERGIEAMLDRNRLDDVFRRHQLVREPQSVARFKVKLMLPCRHLMMAGFDTDAHTLQRIRHLAAYR